MCCCCCCGSGSRRQGRPPERPSCSSAWWRVEEAWPFVFFVAPIPRHPHLPRQQEGRSDVRDDILGSVLGKREGVSELDGHLKELALSMDTWCER